MDAACEIGVDDAIDHRPVVDRLAVAGLGVRIGAAPFECRRAVAGIQQVVRTEVDLAASQLAELDQQLAAVLHGGVVRLVGAEEAPHRRQRSCRTATASTVTVTGLGASAAIACAAKIAASAQQTIDPARTIAACMYFPRLRARIWTGRIGLRKECAVGRTCDITMDMDAAELVITPARMSRSWQPGMAPAYWLPLC